MEILLVEDNRRLNNSLRLSLVDDGYAVDPAFTGTEGEELATLEPYDAIILDIMLPEKDGLQVCRDLRRQRINTPILMLTARDAIEDRVAGLDSGADDYLTKPFDFDELLARVKALLRRDKLYKARVLHIGHLEIDTGLRRVVCAGEEVTLTSGG
jgi:DNA-binding response OmpR family regulator